jgi:4-hydroxyphenylacetate 3-monooxygenase
MTMAARAGKQFLERLRNTKRQLWVEGERVHDVTSHPALAGAAQTLAGIFDRQHAFPEDCLTPDAETGEPVNVGHMIPRSTI